VQFRRKTTESEALALESELQTKVYSNKNYVYLLTNRPTSYLPWHVWCSVWHHRLFVTISRFHRNIKNYDCSFHAFGHFRLIQKKQCNKLCYCISTTNAEHNWFQQPCHAHKIKTYYLISRTRSSATADKQHISYACHSRLANWSCNSL